MAYSSHAKRWMTVLVIVPILVVFFLKAPAWAFAIFGGLYQRLRPVRVFQEFLQNQCAHGPGAICFAVIGSSLIFWAAAIGSFKLLFLVMWLMFFRLRQPGYDPIQPGQGGLRPSWPRKPLSILYIPCLLSSVVLARCQRKRRDLALFHPVSCLSYQTPAPTTQAKPSESTSSSPT